MTAQPSGLSGSAPDEVAPRSDRVVSLAGMRKAIAKNVATSLQSSAQVTSFFEIDAGPVLAVRDHLSSRRAADDRVGLNAMLVAALAKTLRDHPLFNAHAGDREVTIYGSINVGVAIALDDSFGLGGGLIVPVVHNADTKSLTAIGTELADKIERARASALEPDEVHGGTFTLTNLGSLPGAELWRGATPVINGAQSGILGVGRVRQAVVVGADLQPIVGSRLDLSLTHDHRLLDGAAAGAFVRDLVEALSTTASFEV